VKPIGVILPFRDGGTGRTAQLVEALSSWKKQTEGLSDVYVITDDDETIGHPALLESFSDVKWLTVPSDITLMEKLNYHALDIADKHEYIQFLAHDIVLRTPWESKFIDFLEDVPVGMVYGNDLVHNGKLATHPCIKSSMIKAVGFYGCPAVEHNFFDNYWMAVAQSFGMCMYLSDVIMEHNHPIVGKAKKDKISESIYSMLESDQVKYSNYMNSKVAVDIQNLKNKILDIKLKIVDCFPFYDEFMMLDIRFHELYNLVDHFVIVESPETFTGNPKKLWLSECLQQKYPQYADKVTIITPKLYPGDVNPWEREKYQKNHINKGALAQLNLNDNDVVLVGDADEIIRAENLMRLLAQGVTEDMSLEYDFSYYKFNRVFPHKWYQAKVTLFSKFTDFWTTRYSDVKMIANNSGWHFSYIKDNVAIQDKLNAFSHQEYGDKIKDLNYIQKCIEQGKSLFDDGMTAIRPIDHSFPKYIKENLEALKEWIA
jgi:beta-1,4-mannosyl-glycoprotein beta-1,4-N-acetylglucosaminyltransferase